MLDIFSWGWQLASGALLLVLLLAYFLYQGTYKSCIQLYIDFEQLCGPWSPGPPSFEAPNCDILLLQNP